MSSGRPGPRCDAFALLILRVVPMLSLVLTASSSDAASVEKSDVLELGRFSPGYFAPPPHRGGWGAGAPKGGWTLKQYRDARQNCQWSSSKGVAKYQSIAGEGEQTHQETGAFAFQTCRLDASGADGAAQLVIHRIGSPDGKPTEMKHGAWRSWLFRPMRGLDWRPHSASGKRLSEGDLVWYTAHRFFPVFAQNGTEIMLPPLHNHHCSYFGHRGGTTADTACEPGLRNELSSTADQLCTDEQGGAECIMYRMPDWHVLAHDQVKNGLLTIIVDDVRPALPQHHEEGILLYYELAMRVLIPPYSPKLVHAWHHNWHIYPSTEEVEKRKRKHSVGTADMLTQTNVIEVPSEGPSFITMQRRFPCSGTVIKESLHSHTKFLDELLVFRGDLSRVLDHMGYHSAAERSSRGLSALRAERLANLSIPASKASLLARAAATGLEVLCRYQPNNVRASPLAGLPEQVYDRMPRPAGNQCDSIAAGLSINAGDIVSTFCFLHPAADGQVAYGHCSWRSVFVPGPDCQCAAARTLHGPPPTHVGQTSRRSGTTRNDSPISEVAPHPVPLGAQHPRKLSSDPLPTYTHFARARSTCDWSGSQAARYRWCTMPVNGQDGVGWLGIVRTQRQAFPLPTKMHSFRIELTMDHLWRIANVDEGSEIFLTSGYAWALDGETYRPLGYPPLHVHHLRIRPYKMECPEYANYPSPEKGQSPAWADSVAPEYFDRSEFIALTGESYSEHRDHHDLWLSMPLHTGQCMRAPRIMVLDGLLDTSYATKNPKLHESLGGFNRTLVIEAAFRFLTKPAIPPRRVFPVSKAMPFGDPADPRYRPAFDTIWSRNGEPVLQWQTLRFPRAAQLVRQYPDGMVRFHFHPEVTDAVLVFHGAPSDLGLGEGLLASPGRTKKFKCHWSPCLGSPLAVPLAPNVTVARDRGALTAELAKIELLSRCSNGAAAAAAVPALRVRRELLLERPASAKIACIYFGGNEVHKDGMVFARRSSMVEPPGGGCELELKANASFTWVIITRLMPGTSYGTHGSLHNLVALAP